VKDWSRIERKGGNIKGIREHREEGKNK